MKPERRLRLFIVARVVVTILFLVSIAVLKQQDPEAIESIAFRGMMRLMASSCLFSLLSLVVLRYVAWHQLITYLQIIWDLLFVTLLLVFTDGIASPYSFLYLLAIMNAGMLLSRREALYTAALCGILYGAMVDLQFYGFLSTIGLSPLAALQKGEGVVFYTIFLHLTGFMLTAFVAGYLSERARSSEDALRVTEINYAELRQLHSMIVENIEYGLMTVSRHGLIQVFNPFVQQLTAYSQEEAYGKPVASVFPLLPLGDREPACRQQGEFSYRPPTGEPLVVGYTVIPFADADEALAGRIVTLRNLTEIRQMELALKRADRLAALGELSARMAHEIRNPLAAISGSVQLLAGHGALREDEARLLSIVLRESDRLNDLISEFLAYARPAPPILEHFDLVPFIRDLVTLLAADPRFDKIDIQTSLPNSLTLVADQRQLQQVLMNLLQNAAEAMPSGGPITLLAGVQQAIDDNGTKFSLIRLAVEDHGCGLEPETRQHLFEPFWTTKPTGTGLGLATVYRIIESHGGTIQAEDRDGGGTIFTILLPVIEGSA